MQSAKRFGCRDCVVDGGADSGGVPVPGPALVFLTLFNFFPAAFAFYISLFRWGLIQEEFVGQRTMFGC